MCELNIDHSALMMSEQISERQIDWDMPSGGIIYKCS